MRFLVFILFPLSLQAQFTYRIDQSIPVSVNDTTLLNPWAGGLNSPEINTMDLNADGQDDLVIFEKTASKISTFLAVNKKYVYAPEYELFFPAEINTFVVLRDYNCDGKKDLFTFGQIGILVFQNVTQPGKPLSWKKLSFYVAPGLKSEVLLTLGLSGKINLLPGVNDLPQFKDMDGDGDLDVLNMRFVTPSSAEFHKNFSMERYGRCDSLELEKQTSTWGGFEECLCGQIAFGETCTQLGGRVQTGSRIQHTGGKAVLTLDIDNDGDQDLLYSEEMCSRIYFMQNQGNANVAVMNGFTLFPLISPVGIQLYPAPYLVDVDFDGKMDLVSSMNLYSRSALDNDFQHSVWFYKNTGTNQLPGFTYVKSNFLQEDMIEVGDYSAPAFTDIDQDGDDDLFIGQYINQNLRSSILFYENVGTAQAPSFKFVTDDFVGLSFFFQYNIKPQFYDVDRNGGLDLVFTATDLQSGRTSLNYILSSSSNSSSFGGQSMQTMNVAMGIDENVTMADINQDGNVDLLIGRSNGALEYWRNTGSGNTFFLSNDKFMGLGASTLRQDLTAVLGDLDGDGKADLVVGDHLGQLSVYPDFRSNETNAEPVTGLVFDIFSNSYASRNLGGRLRPVVSNLFGTDKPAIVVGNTMGGLSVLKNDNGQVLSDEISISLFPNPLPYGQALSIKADRNINMDVYTMLGQRIGTSFFVPANQITTYPFQGVAPGIYIARFSGGNKSLSIRFIVQ